MYLFIKTLWFFLQGVKDVVDGLAIYQVGQGEKCIIWNYDIFGLDSGRTK